MAGQAAPPTIHDFGGFPRQLFEMQYPAQGSDALAQRVRSLVQEATTNDEWGYDHGTWSVLAHLRPRADVPVIQLSLNGQLSPAQHLAIGQSLRPLRDEGILIVASGNITHNLRHALQSMRRGETTTPPWAAL